MPDWIYYMRVLAEAIWIHPQRPPSSPPTAPSLGAPAGQWTRERKLFLRAAFLSPLMKRDQMPMRAGMHSPAPQRRGLRSCLLHLLLQVPFPGEALPISPLGTSPSGLFTPSPRTSWDRAGIIKINLIKSRLKVTRRGINKRTRFLGRDPSQCRSHLLLGSDHLSLLSQALLRAHSGGLSPRDSEALSPSASGRSADFCWPSAPGPLLWD